MPNDDVTPRSDRELATSRLVAAEPADVFDAFRDPGKLARWWGPAGFTNTFHEFRFEPGGAWRYTMHGPDGTDFANESEFVEIAAPSRVVIRHVTNPPFEAGFTFEPRPGGTLVVFRQVFATAEVCRKMAAFVVEANEQNLDRLTAVVVGPAG